MARGTSLTIAAVAAFASVAIGYRAITVAPRDEASSLARFAPDRVADLELRMWQAYYAKERTRLFGLLVLMLREQYHYSWATATVEGFHLARAAARLGDMTSNYESVLPDLEQAYATAKSSVHGAFDPGAVARAELAWWVARRVPGHDSAGDVGALIRDEYALLYGVPASSVACAGQLRAEAAALRDEEAAQPDWTTIGALLRASYRSLHDAITTPAASEARTR